MPKYHFEIIDGFRLEDPMGQDCSDDAQAKTVADGIASHIAEDIERDDHSRAVVVLDDNGTEVYHTAIDDESDDAVSGK